MKIEHVMRYRCTIVTGILDFDVKIGDDLEIVTATETIPVQVVGIETLNKSWKNALLFRGVMEKVIKPGDTVKLPQGAI